jgi:uncharacterized protein
VIQKPIRDKKMIQIGQYNTLKVIRQAAMGVFLDDGATGLLLPNRFVPPGTQVGDELEVFVYHDGEDRPIATTLRPKGILGDIVKLTAVSVTPQGAFLDNGLMKDLFVPRSKQLQGMRAKGEYLVKIYLDEQTGRMAATEKIAPFLSNEAVALKEKELVHCTVYRRTDIGYLIIINHQYTGVLHHNEVYRNMTEGDTFTGFVKQLYETDNPGRDRWKIDVAAGQPGYGRVEGEADKVMRLLQENDGYLPYHDKSAPEEIYDFFGMSKKTFKMATGNLYRQQKIVFEEKGIRLL